MRDTTHIHLINLILQIVWDWGQMTSSFTSHKYLSSNVNVNTLRGIYYRIGFLSFLSFVWRQVCSLGTQNVEIDLELPILLPPPSETVYNQAWLDLLYGYGHPSWDWQCSQSTVLCNTLWFGWRKLPDKSFGLSVILPRSSHMTPFTVILRLVTSLLCCIHCAEFKNCFRLARWLSG